MELGSTATGAVIYHIHEDGLIGGWNQANKMLRLYPGVRITEVNSVAGYWAIVEKLQMPGVLTLKVCSCPPKGTGPNWFSDVAAIGKSLQTQRGASVTSNFMIRLQQVGSRDPGPFASLPTVAAGDCNVDQCAICMDSVGPGEAMVQFSCTHAFHPLCTARWLVESSTGARGNGQCCPLCCRKVVCSANGRTSVASAEAVRG